MAASTPRQGVDAFRSIPRYVQYTSPVSHAPPDGEPSTALPLNLILVIVSYLHDPADIARLARASRLLYYMTLPVLYSKVSLHSYSHIRYVDGRPEGFGSGSPFTMALNGLVTKGHAAMVQDFRVWGNWNELGVEDFAKGRVPDNSMMLNILMRAAMDKMKKLRTFSWELDCKPLKTLYQGLSNHTTLTTLTIKFPNSRAPRPSVLIPPMPNLRVFKATDIDPLCYPDDISLLLFQSRKLEDLRLHFSPRMREEAECSLSIQTFFGRCLRAGYRLPIKHFALHNFFAPKSADFECLCDLNKCKSVCFFNVFGGDEAESKTVFVDETWRHVQSHPAASFGSLRCNEMGREHVELLRKSYGLEKMYFVSARDSENGNTRESTPIGGKWKAPATPEDSSPPDGRCAALGKGYLHALTRSHGRTLKHLLLSDLWALTEDDISDLIRFCPNLEQMGIALSLSNTAALRLLLPFLPKLHSLRILQNEWLSENLKGQSREEHMEAMSKDLAKMQTVAIRYVGLGSYVYKTGKNYQCMGESGTVEWRREISMASQEEVSNIEIWANDCLDIGKDPVAPFSP